jgi:hypothetical protein
VQLERCLRVADGLHDERRQRESDLRERRVQLLVQERVHGVRLGVRERADGQQQLRLLRAYLHEQPAVRERDVYVQLRVLPGLPAAQQQVLQEQHDLRVRVPRAGLQLTP